MTETFGCGNGLIESLILATISHIFPENPLIKLFRCYSAHPVSVVRFTGFEKLFQSALKSSLAFPVRHEVLVSGRKNPGAQGSEGQVPRKIFLLKKGDGNCTHPQPHLSPLRDKFSRMLFWNARQTF